MLPPPVEGQLNRKLTLSTLTGWSLFRVVCGQRAALGDRPTDDHLGEH
jgi:hypothetical protein